MNPGLVYLLRRRPAGWVRLVSRRFTGVKRVFALLGVGALAALVIGSQVLVARNEPAEEVAATVASVRLWGPPALMLFACLGASSGAGLSFRPAEVAFLFPAPVGRRELLLYHVLGKLMAGVLSSLWISIFVVRWTPCWHWGLCGVLFASIFLQLSTELATLVLANASVRATALVKRVLWIAGLGLVAGGVLFVRQQEGGATFVEGLRQVVGSTPVQVVVAPARVFVELYAAESVGAAVVWGAAGLGILVLMFGLLVGLDVAYTDAALVSSRRVQERLRRIRAGGTAMTAAAPARARFSLPRLPWWRGAGPFAWRQGLEILRNLRGIVATAVIIIGFPMLSVLVPSTIAEGRAPEDVAALEGVPVFGFVMIVVMSLFTTQNLALDFRRDIDRMAFLKSLPVRPGALAFGQIAPAILALTLLQLVAVGVLIAASGKALPWPSFLLVLVPFNWLGVALDNVLFLIFPYRITVGGAGQFQFMGRMMLTMTVKMFVLMFAVGLAAGGGVLAHVLVASWPLTALMVSAVLAVEGVAVTSLLGRVFAEYDVNKDVAG